MLSLKNFLVGLGSIFSLSRGYYKNPSAKSVQFGINKDFENLGKDLSKVLKSYFSNQSGVDSEKLRK